MNKKIKKVILKLLFQEKQTLQIQHVIGHCVASEIDEKKIKNDGVTYKKIKHVIDVLDQSGLIQIINYAEGPLRYQGLFLTQLGYQEFDPWYKKTWNFITDDFSKLMSLISLILSIIATFISIYSK